jgi:hypothetical protein
MTSTPHILRPTLAALLLLPGVALAQYGLDDAGLEGGGDTIDFLEELPEAPAAATPLAEVRPGYRNDSPEEFRARDEQFLAHLQAERARIVAEHEAETTRWEGLDRGERYEESMAKNPLGSLASIERPPRFPSYRIELLDEKISHLEWSVRRGEGPEMLDRLVARAEQVAAEIRALDRRGDGTDRTHEVEAIRSIPGVRRFGQDLRPRTLERRPIEGLTPEAAAAIQAERERNAELQHASRQERKELGTLLQKLFRYMKLRQVGPYEDGASPPHYRQRPRDPLVRTWHNS